MPQDDGSSIPFDISVTACIPSVYHHILLLMEEFDIELIDARSSYRPPTEPNVRPTFSTGPLLAIDS